MAPRESGPQKRESKRPSGRAARIERLKSTLERRKDAVREMLDSIEKGIQVPSDVRDVIDEADLSSNGEVNASLTESLSQELRSISEALRRDAFGICSTCEKTIPLARLEALPYTERCLRCQRAYEDGHPPQADLDVDYL